MNIKASHHFINARYGKVAELEKLYIKFLIKQDRNHRIEEYRVIPPMPVPTCQHCDTQEKDINSSTETDAFDLITTEKEEYLTQLLYVYFQSTKIELYNSYSTMKISSSTTIWK